MLPLAMDIVDTVPWSHQGSHPKHVAQVKGQERRGK
jgi:hypothetical protein